MKYSLESFNLDSKLRLNLKCSNEEKKILLFEEDRDTRHHYLSTLIQANNNSRRGLSPLFKVVCISYPSEELIAQVRSMGGQVIEARNYQTNLFYPEPWHREVEFIKDQSASFSNLLQDMAQKENLFYPHKVYNKLLPLVENMSPGQKEIFHSFPSIVKMSFFPRQIVSRYFSHKLGQQWSIPINALVEKYLETDTSPSLSSFVWFLVENNEQRFANQIAEIANSLDKELFFSLNPTHKPGHALFIANHPNEDINKYLTTSFIQESKGEFVSNNHDNYFIIDERFRDCNDLLYEQLSRVFPRANQKRLTVLYSSSFVPTSDSCPGFAQSLLSNELLFVMDALIVGKLPDYTELSQSPFPEAVSNENKRSAHNREKLLMYLREGTVFKRL